MKRHITTLLTLSFLLSFLVGFVLAQTTIELSEVANFVPKVGVFYNPYNVEKSSISSNACTYVSSDKIYVGSSECEYGSFTEGFSITGGEVLVSTYQGGEFSIEDVDVVDPIKELGWMGANKSHTINVTIWSPYGVDYVTFVNLSIGEMVFEYRPDTGLTAKNVEGKLYNYSAVLKEGSVQSVHFLLSLTPAWEINGTFDLRVYAEDSIHGYSDEVLLESFITFVNETYLLSYSFDKQFYNPADIATLTLKVAYNDTETLVKGETVWVDGTTYTTDDDGTVVHSFVTPERKGSYSIEVILEHGGTYTLTYRVCVPENRMGGYASPTHPLEALIPSIILFAIATISFLVLRRKTAT